MALSFVKTSIPLMSMLRCVAKRHISKPLVRALSAHALQSQVEAMEQDNVISNTASTAVDMSHPDFFGVSDLVNMREMFDARVHIGHKSGVRHPYMRPYLFGSRLGVDIIDLAQTAPRLQAALNFMAHIAARGGIILFVTASSQTLPLVELAARSCGEYSHCRQWRGGTFTNSTRLYGAVTRLPDLCVFIGTHNAIMGEHCAVVEAAKLNIPSAAIVDTSCDPRLITYPVPANDDTPAAVSLYCRVFAEAVRRGKQWAAQAADNGLIDDYTKQ